MVGRSIRRLYRDACFWRDAFLLLDSNEQNAKIAYKAAEKLSRSKNPKARGAASVIKNAVLKFWKKAKVPFIASAITAALAGLAYLKSTRNPADASAQEDNKAIKEATASLDGLKAGIDAFNRLEKGINSAGRQNEADSPFEKVGPWNN